MADRKQSRQQYFVDRRVQGGLIFRAIMYWVYCFIAVSSLVLTWSLLSNPTVGFSYRVTYLWEHFGPAVAASLLILPILAYDMVRFSNRFTGPIVRLRNAIGQVAEGEEVAPISFRDHDYWQELAGEFNRLLERVKTLESKSGEASDSNRSPEVTISLDESTLCESTLCEFEDGSTEEKPLSV